MLREVNLRSKTLLYLPSMKHLRPSRFRESPRDSKEGLQIVPTGSSVLLRHGLENRGTKDKETPQNYSTTSPSWCNSQRLSQLLVCTSHMHPAGHLPARRRRGELAAQRGMAAAQPATPAREQRLFYTIPPSKNLSKAVITAYGSVWPMEAPPNTSRQP